MGIIMIYNFDPYIQEVGGGRRYVENLIIFLCKHKVDITLLGILSSKTIPNRSLDFKFFPILKKSFINRGDAGAWWKYLIGLFIKVPFMKFNENDVIHTHHIYFMLPFIIFHKNIPKVSTFHGVHLSKVKIKFPHLYMIIEPIYKIFESYIINNVDVLTTAGAYPKTALLIRYPNLKLSEKINIIPSGVDLDIFKPMDKVSLRSKYNLDKYKYILIYLGRLSREKNLPFLFNSISKLSNQSDDYLLMVIGKGELEIELKEYVIRNNINNIKFYGEYTGDKLVELINCADVLTLTSLYEASPTVVKESISCGVPVISTNVGDVSKIICSKDLGVVVDSYDENVFANTLISYKDYLDANQSTIIEICRNTAIHQFGFSSVTQEFIKCYDTAIAMRKKI